LKGIRPGDAVVAFSRRNIFRLKFAIEKQSGLACSVVYGSLPPPVRAQQAAKFNTHESPVLVASDAIAMGLNMHIGRIVFSTMDKFDGTDVRPLENPLIRQIGGRAGRYQSRYPEGLVTCLHEEDMPRLKTAFSETNIAALSRAGLKPTFEALAQFSSSMPQAALSHVMDRFVALTQLNADSYFVCDFEDEKIIADALEHVPGLSLEDRYVFCCSPSDTDSAVAMGFLLRFARAHAKGEPVRLNVGLPVRPPMTEVALQKLEALYAVVDLYMWLSYRFPHTFCERDAAAQARERARYLIEEGLEAQTRQAAERDESAVLRRPHRQPRPVQREMSAEEQLVAEEARREERRQRRKWKRRVSGMGDDASGQIFTLGEDEASLMRWQDYQTAR
jgi:ATP-dependent RNA helicase SUPV3L1/SUV3